LYFATDVHGSEKCWKKFIRAGQFYEANVIIMGGDLTGKAIIPIVEQGNHSQKASFLGKDVVVDSDERLRELMKMISDRGYYPYLTDTHQMEELSVSQEKIDKLFTQLMMERLRRWVQLADEQLERTDIQCYVCPGNDDRLEVDRIFEESSTVINATDKVVSVDENHEMINVGWTNTTPWKTPRECEEKELARRIDDQVSQLKHVNNSIFELHAPPYGSPLDQAPKLDESMKASPGVTMPAGSIAVAEAITKYQPLLGLHGHIHESRAVVTIGRTICANPGSTYESGVLFGVLVNLDKDKVKNYVTVSG
jgi:hypothetical protein